MSALATELPHAQALGPDDLRQLMRSVNEAAERLHSTHAALAGEVARLRGELEQANAQLRRSRTLAALGEMAAGIAHEVRNPLASIRLYAQVLAEDLAGQAQPAGLCASIAQAIDRIEAIVRDVLRFARDTTPQAEATTAADLFARALESSAAILAQAGVAVENRAAQGPPVPLQADGGLMTQALGNVIRNAAEAMEEAGADTRCLVLTALRQRRRVPAGVTAPRIVLGVQDTGPGISPEVLSRMFNPFFTTRRAGTGLGLAIVHRIVEAHGGHVSVANRPEGGTTVELCLPGRPPARAARPELDHGQDGHGDRNAHGQDGHGTRSKGFARARAHLARQDAEQGDSNSPGCARARIHSARQDAEQSDKDNGASNDPNSHR